MSRGRLLPVRAWLLALATVLGTGLALAQDPPAGAPQDPPAEAPQDPAAEAPQDPQPDTPAPGDPAPAEPAPAAGPPAHTGTDIVCLLDRSRSVGRADLKGDRIATLQVLLSVIARHAGDRVAVAQYAGDAATRSGSTLLDWTAIPRDGFEQQFAFDRIFEALHGAAEADARASDWNAATGVALRALLETRGDATGRPLWILLVTDGELDPIEGDNDPPAAYMPEDPASLNGQLRAHVTAAAEEQFLSTGLQQLVQPGVWVTPLQVGPGGGTRDLCALVASHTGAAVLNVNELGPLGVLERVLAELPASVHPAVQLRVLVDETTALTAGTPATLTLPVPLAGRPAISVFEVPDGSTEVRPALEGGEPGELTARTIFGGRQRVVAWHDAWGRDEAAITAAADGTARVLHLATLEYDAVIELEDPSVVPASTGTTVQVAVSLREPGNSSPLEALSPFDDAVAHIEVLDADGNVAGTASGPIFGEFTLRGVIAVTVPDGVRGACRLRVVVSAVKRSADSDPLFRSAPAELELAVRAPLMVRFAVPRPFVQQAVAVYGEPDGPRPADATLTVPIAAAGAEPVPVPVEWNDETGRYEGVWIPAAIGTARVVEGVSGSADVRLAPGATCDVRPRSMEVTPAPDANAPQSAVPAEAELVSLRRGDDGALEGRVRVAASLLQGETGSVLVRAIGADGAPLAGLVVAPEGGAPVGDGRVAVGPAPQIVLVRFTDPPAAGANLSFAGELPGAAITKTLAIGVPRSGMLRLIVGLIALLFLLIGLGLLFQRYTCPAFDDRQLRLHTPGRTAERTRYLREFPRAGWGRVGLGTTEAPRSVEFRLVGLKGLTPIRCRISSRKPYIRIQVNGSDLQGHRDLQDGDQIVLKGATLALRYTYYEQEGPAGEQTRMLQREDHPPTVAETLEGEVLGPDEFVLVHEKDLPYLLAADPGASAETLSPDTAPEPPVDRATAETGAFAEDEEPAAETLGEGTQWPVEDGPGEDTSGYGEATGEFDDAPGWPVAPGTGDETGWPAEQPPGEDTGWPAAPPPGEETGWPQQQGPGEETGWPAAPGTLGEETNVAPREDLDATLGGETDWADQWASQLGEETGVDGTPGSQLGEQTGYADEPDGDDDDVDNAQTLDESTQIDMSPLERRRGRADDADDADDTERDEAAETLGDDNTLAPGGIEDDLPDFLR